MKCPRCVQKIHLEASSCPHCGFTMVHADGVFGSQDIKLKKFSDVAGVFRMKEREPMRKTLEDFEVLNLLKISENLRNSKKRYTEIKSLNLICSYLE